MAQDIHPETHPVIFRDTSNGEEFFTTSTLTSDETKEVDGTEYYVIDIEITSASHPFFTGEQRFVDTEGQVDKFKARMEKVEEKQQEREEIKQRQKQKQQDDEDEEEQEDDLEQLKEEVQESETEKKNEEEPQQEEEDTETKPKEEATKNEFDYKELVKENIPEVKDAVKNKDISTEKVLAAEKDNKERKTLISWLENKIGNSDEA